MFYNESANREGEDGNASVAACSPDIEMEAERGGGTCRNCNQIYIYVKRALRNSHGHLKNLAYI